MAHRIVTGVVVGFLALVWPVVALLALLVWVALGITRDDNEDSPL